MDLTGNTMRTAATQKGRADPPIGREQALRAGRSSRASRLQRSMRRWVCSYLLWRLQRSRTSLRRRLGRLDDAQLKALGIRPDEIETVLVTTLEVLAQAASEPR